MRFLSQVYTIARGSVGGITYTANQWHQLIARARTSPVQPGTPFQTGIKSAFDIADDDWRVLSEPVKDDWRNYAQTCTYQGPLGSYTVPGRQLFIGTTALVKYTRGIAPLLGINYDNIAPVIAGFLNPGSVLVATYGGLTQGIAISIGLAPGDTAIAVIDHSVAFNQTRNRFKGPWISNDKTVGLLAGGATTTFNINLVPGTLQQAMFTRTRIFSASVSPDPAVKHRISALFYLRHIVEAAP